MSIAEKLTTVSENVPKVYEAGKQAERTDFWDKLQQGGTRQFFPYAFAYDCWTDDIYNPIYPISSTSINYLYYLSAITDTKVDIEAQGTSVTGIFQGSAIKTIRKFIVNESLAYTVVFQNCTKLENITFEGVIGKNGLNLQWSTKLSHDSLMSLINCLQDKTGDTSGTTWTVTLGATNIAKLTADEQKIAEDKGWNLG